MCGIVGSYDLTASTKDDELTRVITQMTASLRHRGPDGEARWSDAAAGIALGQTRLAVRDLSPSGRQPMVSSCGRHVMVYNGEIYSQAELARGMGDRARTLRGHSDTELILESFAEHGVDHTIDRLIGMFAIALFDRQTGDLTLVRDRLGIKPLYWSVADHQVLLGSELKALKAAQLLPLRLDRGALASYLRFAYVPAPASIYTNVHKVRPATIVTIKRNGEVREKAYWSLADLAAGPRAGISQHTEGEYLDRLDALLVDAVQRRLVSDVPLGALLSGGFDSSLVTSLMAETSSSTVQTFTVGFEDARYDESDHARAVAKHLGTDHHETIATARDVMDLVTDVPRYYDEPFADSSQLPTMLVSALTRGDVTVALSGDGGDELFLGYSRYSVTENALRRGLRIPGAARGLVGAGLARTPSSALDALSAAFPRRYRRARFGERVNLVGECLQARDFGPMYLALLSHWPDPGALVRGGHELPIDPITIPMSGSLRQTRDAMRLYDMGHYLPDDILTKVDRASMRVALEARVPLLDHRVVEFAWTYPSELMVRDGTAKWPLRSSLYRRVPRALVDRPKRGFSAPIGEWLRGPLRSWAADLLDPVAIESRGVLAPSPVQQAWQGHLAGAPNEYLLWTILMLQSWLNENPETVGPS